MKDENVLSEGFRSLINSYDYFKYTILKTIFIHFNIWGLFCFLIENYFRT